MEENDIKAFDSKLVFSETEDMKKYINELLASLKADEDVYNIIKPLGLSVKEVRNNIGKM